MAAVIVALGGQLKSDLLLPDVDRLISTGLDVHLVTWAPPSPDLAAAVGEVVVLAPAFATSSAQPVSSSDRAAQEVLEHAEDSLSAGDLPESERLEESLAMGDEGAEGETPDEDPGSDVAPAPRVKATGVARVGELSGRVLRNPRPYVARVHTLTKRRTRPVRAKVRRGLRRRVRGFRSNVHQVKVTTAFFRNDQVRRLMADADVLVAVDSSSILAVWAVARRSDEALAVIGVDAAIARRGTATADQ